MAVWGWGRGGWKPGGRSAQDVLSERQTRLHVCAMAVGRVPASVSGPEATECALGVDEVFTCRGRVRDCVDTFSLLGTMLGSSGRRPHQTALCGVCSVHIPLSAVASAAVGVDI